MRGIPLEKSVLISNYRFLDQNNKAADTRKYQSLFNTLATDNFLFINLFDIRSRQNKSGFYLVSQIMTMLFCIIIFGSLSAAAEGKVCLPNFDAGSECTKYPCLILEDNFDTLDHDLWQHEITASGGGNWEFQYYTNNRSNSFVKNGVLHIKPTLTKDTFSEQFLTKGVLDLWGMNGPYQTCTGQANYGCRRQGTADNIINPIQSARIRSVNSFSFKYGKLEVRARLPKGDWIWPAIWLLPRQFSYGDWPASGEIDLVEARGNEKLFTKDNVSIGIDQVGSTLHWGPFFAANSFDRTHATKNLKNGTFADNFHLFSFQWDENGMDFFVDNQKILHVDPGQNGFWQFGDFAKRFPGISNPWANGAKMAPFDKDFYIIMNVAVGGTGGYFKDTFHPKKPWDNNSKFAMRDFWNARNKWLPTWQSDDVALKVDHIKVWKLKADPGKAKECTCKCKPPSNQPGHTNKPTSSGTRNCVLF